MTSRYNTENITFTNVLKRPNTAKGAILAHNGIETFEIVEPKTDCEVLTANSSATGGVEYTAGTQGSGFSFIDVDVDIPGLNTGRITYFMIDSGLASSYARPIPLPNCSAIFLGVCPNNTSDGWASNNTSFNGGALEITLGYFDLTDQPLPSNFNPYSGGPHLSIPFSSINSVGTAFASFTTSLNIDVTSGQQVSLELVNTITRAGPTPVIRDMTSFILFQGK